MNEGINAIVGMYILLRDVNSLLAMKSHREKLLSEAVDTEHYSLAYSRELQHQDIAAIEAGIDAIMKDEEVDGHVDFWRSDAIIGLAVYIQYPDIRVLLEVYGDGVLIGKTTADLFRKGHLRAGIENGGHHGFQFAPPPESLDDFEIIEVKSMKGKTIRNGRFVRSDPT